MMAVKSPARNFPFTHFSIVLYPRLRPSDTEYDKSLNCKSTSGLLGRCVNVMMGFFCPFGLLLGTFRSAPVGMIDTFDDPLQTLLCESLKKIRQMLECMYICIFNQYIMFFVTLSNQSKDGKSSSISLCQCVKLNFTHYKLLKAFFAK